MYFKQILIGNMSNFTYLFGCEKTKEAAVVDPAFDQDRILQQARSDGMDINYIFTTHSHYDHVGGHKEMVAKTGAQIVAHRLTAEEMSPHHIPVQIKVEDNDELKVGEIPVKIILTPGHTPGGICLLIDERKLITGDSLFVGDCGRTDLPGGNAKDLYESIEFKLKVLDETVEVYPGHDYGEHPSSTIGKEKKDNPAMNCLNLEEFKSLP